MLNDILAAVPEERNHPDCAPDCGPENQPSTQPDVANPPTQHATQQYATQPI